ncbi:hypothetical protein [Thioalkalivibrio sp. ALJ7]|uniref:hypothetical protein n=1 Tax=Thioalkalivibrio sp. ALJ7 TaxID=1158756 RepID=UPI0009DA9BE9|nr:hypothetical protein [Thioalkalivibrio sp. ALJ7]
MWVPFAIFALVVLSLAAFRLYTQLAVHERRVVAAWDRLDTLLTQRNGQLHECYLANPDVDLLERLGSCVQVQETARRRGDLLSLAQAERDIRSSWDSILSHPIDSKTKTLHLPKRAERRVAALDQALSEALARYNQAVVDYAAMRCRRGYGVLARLTGFTNFRPVTPPNSP